MTASLPFIKIQDVKAIDYSVFGSFEGFLRDTSNGAGGWSTIDLLLRISPFLSKAVDMTAVAVASIPFDILDKGGDPIDTSDDWHNTIGCMDNPRRLLYLLASSLCRGRAYLIPQYIGANKLIDLRYIAPQTVLPLITTQGLQWFSRASDYGNAGIYSPKAPFPAIKSETKQAPAWKDKPALTGNDWKMAKDYALATYVGDVQEQKIATTLEEQNNISQFTGQMVYFWLPDAAIEIGPAKKYPLGTASVSAQMCAALDNAVKLLADRNFVSPHLISAEAMGTQQDRDKTENWLNRFLKGDLTTFVKVFQSKAGVQVQKVGAGIEDIKESYPELKRQAIEEIGSAFGIPAAVFMSDKAFASEIYPMLRSWHESGVFVSIYQTIEETLNHQVFEQYGWQMKFDLERLPFFQEDENKRAVAFRDYASARIRPSLIAEMLGINLPEGHEYSEFDEDFDKPEPVPPINPLTNPEQPPKESAMMEQGKQEPKVEGKAVVLSADEIKELGLWYEKAKAWHLKGRGNAVDWECKFLRPEIAEAIREKLAVAENELDIVKAFEVDAAPTSAAGLFAIANALEKLA